MRLVVCTAFLAFSFTAYGGLASFSIRVQDDLRVADVEVVDVGGEQYVSLSSLMNQMGGGCRVTPERVQVDLAAKAAWLNLEVTQVSSSLGAFNLLHPLHGKDGEALIALSDVVSLFQKAFNLAIKQDLPVQSAPPVAEATPAPVAPTATTEAVLEPPSASTADAAPSPSPAPAASTAAPSPEANIPATRAVGRPIQIVILDPGHGGADSGCEGEGALKESQVVLNIAMKVRVALEGSPVKVLLTREKDKDVARIERINFANKNKGDLYIALHLGAGLSQAGHGIEAFCYDPEQTPVQAVSPDTKPVERPGKAYVESSMATAKALLESITEAAGVDARGLRQAPCAGLDALDMPGTILETGYVSNPAEESLLLTEDHQNKLANGIADGIKKVAAVPAGAKP